MMPQSSGRRHSWCGCEKLGPPFHCPAFQRYKQCPQTYRDLLSPWARASCSLHCGRRISGTMQPGHHPSSQPGFQTLPPWKVKGLGWKGYSQSSDLLETAPWVRMGGELCPLRAPPVYGWQLLTEALINPFSEDSSHLF